MQLNLVFLEIPNPSAIVWEELDDEQRIVVLDALAKLIAQAAQPNPNVGDHDND